MTPVKAQFSIGYCFPSPRSCAPYRLTPLFASNLESRLRNPFTRNERAASDLHHDLRHWRRFSCFRVEQSGMRTVSLNLDHLNSLCLPYDQYNQPSRASCKRHRLKSNLHKMYRLKYTWKARPLACFSCQRWFARFVAVHA